MTERQKKFAEEYLLDLNATRAYKAAYPNIKNDETASTNGSKLLRNTKVSEYISEKLNQMSNKRIADATEVMEYLTSVMRREKKENIVVTLTKEESKYVPDETGKLTRKTIKEDVPHIVEIDAKLCDANKAAELLAKRYGLLKENISLDADMDLNVRIDYGTDDTSK